MSMGGRCSGGAVAIGIPSSCLPSDNAASSLAIIARMRSHSFNTDANMLISSSVMASAPSAPVSGGVPGCQHLAHSPPLAVSPVVRASPGDPPIARGSGSRGTSPPARTGRPPAVPVSRVLPPVEKSIDHLLLPIAGRSSSAPGHYRSPSIERVGAGHIRHMGKVSETFFAQSAQPRSGRPSTPEARMLSSRGIMR